MKKNNFSLKFSEKSNAELENILENKYKYTDAAIQAVIWELEKREIISENAGAINEAVVDQKSQENIVVAKEENIRTDSVFDEFELPVLYSKNAIKGFSIFFSVIFGAVLMMYNLKLMDKPKARIQVLIFGILYTIAIYIIVNTIHIQFFLSLTLNLFGASILTGLFWNKNLNKDLNYKSKSITKPLIISLIITSFIILLAFLPLILEE
ncbi:hypothetical protein [Polaribacter sp. Asnod6-C07]|uniref:hypothetical protein n=1 Tax=Polaribacter sp. Asnod6-C07 TaxID=3160582 RepID=UPI00386E51E8